MDKFPWEENLDYVNPEKCSIYYVNEIKETYKNKNDV